MRIELISAVLPIDLDLDPEDVVTAYRGYREALRPLGKPVEFIYVLDGPMPRARAALRSLRDAGEPVEILSFASPFGMAAALTVGFRHAAGDVVFTLTPYPEVLASGLPLLLQELETADLVVARRVPEDATRRPKARKFDSAVNVLFGTAMRDIRCPVRAMRAEVAKELVIYGNQHRFLPLLAQAQGFAVKELDLPARHPPQHGNRTLPVELSLLLDVVTIYFLLRFVRKPFRFFGGFGFAVLAVGGLFTSYLVFERLVLGVPLADRPALVLSTLMVVLGIQIISVGLIGEIVAFTYAKDVRDYRVDRVVGPEGDEEVVVKVAAPAREA